MLFEGRILSVPAREGTELRFDVAGRHRRRAGTRERASRGWSGATRASLRAWANAGACWCGLRRSRTRAISRAPIPARFAFRDRVHLAGRVLPSRLNLRLALAPASVDTPARARCRADRRSGGRSGCRRAAGGARRWDSPIGLSADQWRVFNATGTTHLVAISGLHVTLFALIAFFVARLLWRWLHWLLPWSRCVEREPFALLLGLAAAGAYSLLAGFSVPTQRTWLMLACVALARLTARHAGAGPHLDAGADRRAAARSVRAAGGGILAVVRGRGRHPRGGQRGDLRQRPPRRWRARRVSCACSWPSCWRWPR